MSFSPMDQNVIVKDLSWFKLHVDDQGVFIFI